MLAKIQRYPKTLTVWIFISFLILLTHMVLPKHLAYNFTALLLSVIGSIYIGFALHDSRTHIMVQEISVASFFILLAALGLWLNPYLWVLGLFLHAVWDWLHHPKGIQTKVPIYYPPICVVVDVLIALFLLIWL